MPGVRPLTCSLLVLTPLKPLGRRGYGRQLGLLPCARRAAVIGCTEVRVRGCASCSAPCSAPAVPPLLSAASPFLGPLPIHTLRLHGNPWPPTASSFIKPKCRHFEHCPLTFPGWPESSDHPGPKVVPAGSPWGTKRRLWHPGLDQEQGHRCSLGQVPSELASKLLLPSGTPEAGVALLERGRAGQPSCSWCVSGSWCHLCGPVSGLSSSLPCLLGQGQSPE